MDTETFPTEFRSIHKRILQIDPIEYSKTRHYLKGYTSKISPYLTHGVVSTKEVAYTVLHRYNKQKAYSFIFELAWREYYYIIWNHLKNIIEEDIDQEQTGVIHKKMIKNILNTSTGIKVIDNAITRLHKEGYIHNKERMWIASLVCNIGKSHWKLPSKWMYYYLLDGDIASNTLNWQNIAGTFDSSKIYFNQAEINKYSDSQQFETFIDKPIKELKTIRVPKELQDLEKDFELATQLPKSEIIELDPAAPILLYSIWNLNPNWRKEEIEAQRILVLEPSHFNKYPIGPQRVEFILSLAKNIPNLKLFVGEINQLKGLNRSKNVASIQHPTTEHWPGKKDKPELFFEQVNNKLRSFTDFWEEAQKFFDELSL